ncbi:homoserine dehydrogenase [Emcibacter sp. SYSU 3D8]|uniref:homoserine dehydrogenase n=1 Tax=Emcibacter sp. SYSU 3D8 TaxID=3133969 RepID=UPI0031FEAB4C
MSRPLRVGVAGLGTVGGGVIQVLNRHAALIAQRCGREITVTAVSARNRERDRGLSLEDISWHDNPVALAADPNVDVIAELIGGADGPAADLVEAALTAGKPVVTANKALIAKHGTRLAGIAASQGAALRFEAAVAGGIPIIKALSEGLAGNGLSRIYGILNGTCNYILTEMEYTGRAFEDVLAEAQQLGYAEADPSFDVDGIDTAHKLAILTSVAFGAPLDFESIFVEGIRHITPMDIEFASELGYRIKLVGIAALSEKGLLQRVHPSLVPADKAIAQVDSVFNAVVAEGDFVGQSIYQGRGAGAGPTASAVVADLIDIARGNVHPVLMPPVDGMRGTQNLAMDAHEGRYYVRLSVADQPGVVAEIAAALRDEAVSMEELLQRPNGSGQPVSFVMTTHEVGETSMLRALARIEKLPFIAEKPEVIRIETF